MSDKLIIEHTLDLVDGKIVQTTRWPNRSKSVEAIRAAALAVIEQHGLDTIIRNGGRMKAAHPLGRKHGSHPTALASSPRHAQPARQRSVWRDTGNRAGFQNHTLTLGGTRMSEVYLRSKQLRARYNCSYFWIDYRLANDPTFPKPIYFGRFRHWKPPASTLGSRPGCAAITVTRERYASMQPLRSTGKREAQGAAPDSRADWFHSGETAQDRQTINTRTKENAT
jgi:hypothetical protein